MVLRCSFIFVFWDSCISVLAVTAFAEGRPQFQLMRKVASNEDSRMRVEHRDADRNVIMGMACGMNYTLLFPFVSTLRRVGYTGKVMLGVDPDLHEDTIKFLEKNEITRIVEPCWEQTQMISEGLPEYGRFHGDLNQRRYIYYQKWLRAQKFDKVWLLDVRDVVFQADPFQLANDGFALFEDKQHISRAWSTDRINKCLDVNVTAASIEQNWPELCGGTILGKSKALSSFLSSMIDLVEQVRLRMLSGNHSQAMHAYCLGSDQYLLNYLSFSEHFPGLTVHRNGTGPAVTIDSDAGCPETTAFTSDSATLLNIDRQPYALVHKWDACDSTWHLGHPGESRPVGLDKHSGFGVNPFSKYVLHPLE